LIAFEFSLFESILIHVGAIIDGGNGVTIILHILSVNEGEIGLALGADIIVGVLFAIGDSAGDALVILEVESIFAFETILVETLIIISKQFAILNGGGLALSSVDHESRLTLSAVFGVEGHFAVGDIRIGHALSSDGQCEVIVALVAPQLSSGGGSVSLTLVNVVGSGGQFLIVVIRRGSAVGLVFSIINSHESIVALLTSESSSTDDQSSGEILYVVIGSEIEFELRASGGE